MATLRSVTAYWLDSREIDTAPTTAGWYRAMAKNFEPIEDIDLEELSARHVNTMLLDLVRSGRGATARGVQRTLSGVLASEGIKLVGVRVPRVKKGTGRKGVWTAAQAGQFLVHAQQDRLGAAWALALIGGMRRGELCGLQWDAVDFDDEVVYIREQRTTLAGGQVYHGEPKGTSARTLPIGPGLVELLRSRRLAYRNEAHMAYRRWKGPADRSGGYVFGHANGLPYYPGWFTKRWPVLCKEAGVPVIALHDARHTSGTVGAAAGVDIKTMQSRLGHSDPTILTRIYLHLVDEQARAAATTMERAMRLRR